MLYTESLGDRSLARSRLPRRHWICCRRLPHSEPAEELVRGIGIRLADDYVASAPVIRAALEGLRERSEGTTVPASCRTHTNTARCCISSA